MIGKNVYHYTSFEGFNGIISGHNHDSLCFWLSHSQDMNDEHEIHIGEEIVERVCSQFFVNELIPKRVVPTEESYIISFSQNLDFETMSEYGDIVLVLNQDKLENINYSSCIYVDSNDTDEFERSLFYQMLIDIGNLFWLPISLPFRIKDKKWENELEWRIIENSQKNDVILERKGKRGNLVRYIERIYPKSLLTDVYINKNITVEQEKVMNDLLKKHQFSFKVKRK